MVKLTDTLLGKLRIKLFFPRNDLSLHCSWLYSMIRSPQSSSRINSTMRSKSLRLARRAGEKTTTSRPHESDSAATKMAMLRTLAPPITHTASVFWYAPSRMRGGT